LNIGFVEELTVPCGHILLSHLPYLIFPAVIFLLVGHFIGLSSPSQPLTVNLSPVSLGLLCVTGVTGLLDVPNGTDLLGVLLVKKYIITTNKHKPNTPDAIYKITIVCIYNNNILIF
jgi:hypothetical protein